VGSGGEGVMWSEGGGEYAGVAEGEAGRGGGAGWNSGGIRGGGGGGGGWQG